MWICVLLLFDWVVAVFFVLPISFIPIAITIFIISSITRASRNLNFSSVTPSTQDVLLSLRDMQTRLATTQSHIEELAVEIENRKNEVEEKQKLTQSLDDDINKKLKESDEWKTLNDGQKQLVINAAAEALNNKTLSQNIRIATGAVLLNLVAALIWTLFGNPGRTELIALLKAFFESFSQ